MNSMPSSSDSIRWRLAVLAQKATVLVVALILVACSNSSEIRASLGTPRVTPGELSIAADATDASSGISARVEVPYRFQDLNYEATAELHLNYLAGLPQGLRVESIALVGTDSNENLRKAEAGQVAFDVTVRVTSPTAIGAISPGRHVIQLEAVLRVYAFDDLSQGPNVFHDRRPVDLIIVVGGAAIPSAPADLAATPGVRDVRLRWRADTAPDSYLLERALTGAAFTTVATLSAPITEYQDTGVDPATRYTYRLTPRNAAGTGPAATIEVQTLAVTGNGLVGAAVAGSSIGRVTSSPSGIDCPGDCTESYPLGSTVTLDARPAIGSVFDGWSGPADCADGVITVVVEIACTANFSPAPGGARGWSLIGDLLAAGGEAPLIAPQRASDLHVALRRVNANNGFRELLVMRQNGPQSWVGLPGSPNGIASANWHGFVVDPVGRPIVAWTEASAVRVARFENGVWTRLADNLRIGGGTPVQVQLEWREPHAPVVSWIEIDGGVHRLAVKRMTGDLMLGNGPWVGGFVPDIPNLRGYRMALDSNGLPSLAVSRFNIPNHQPLAVWRVSSIADGAVQAEPLGGDITVAVGIGYQHEPLGYGIGFTLNPDGTSGATVALGVRDSRYAYAKLFNGTSWTQGARINGVLDPDGVVLDANQPGDLAVLGAAMMRTPGIGLVLAVLSNSSQAPKRIELLYHQGLDWLPPTDPLYVPQLTTIGSATIDNNGREVVLTVEGDAGNFNRGRIRAYQWNR